MTLRPGTKLVPFPERADEPGCVICGKTLVAYAWAGRLECPLHGTRGVPKP